MTTRNSSSSFVWSRLLTALTVVLLLIGCASVKSAEGRYLGSIETWHAETTFFGHPVNGTLGTYWYVYGPGLPRHYGELRECSWQEKTKLKCKWSDAGGKRVLRAV